MRGLQEIRRAQVALAPRIVVVPVDHETGEGPEGTREEELHWLKGKRLAKHTGFGCSCRNQVQLGIEWNRITL